jgi:hypothetical protein
VKRYDAGRPCFTRFQSGGMGVWCDLGRYQRSARPHIVRLHQHSGRQPHSRPLGLWIVRRRLRATSG